MENYKMNLRQDIDIKEYSDIKIPASNNQTFDIYYFTGVCQVKWYISFFLIFEGWHSSYANEKTIKKYKDNERLEFLGDAVLELTSSDYIYKNYSNMNEGQMTRLRASIVCEPTLAICARAIGIDNFIMLGKGEELTGGRAVSKCIF